MTSLTEISLHHANANEAVAKGTRSEALASTDFAGNRTCGVLRAHRDKTAIKITFHFQSAERFISGSCRDETAMEFQS